METKHDNKRKSKYWGLGPTVDKPSPCFNKMGYSLS